MAVVVLRGTTLDGFGDDFASELAQRPKCWVKVATSEPGRCPEGVGRIHKGECYMANWAACAKYY
ncbi:hypothetical protein [Myxococcus sp. Y35]|uniref:hypothetical protein n=1 Tax=Pseudomyxococcus flavus TaxID=3115648 RepID=UPI003CEC31FA